MSEIVQPGAVATPERPQARLPRQRVEGSTNAPTIESRSTVGNEHEIRTSWTKELLPPLQIIVEYRACGGMQGYEPGTSELG
jgi:hypothetical protein